MNSEVWGELSHVMVVNMDHHMHSKVLAQQEFVELRANVALNYALPVRAPSGSCRKSPVGINWYISASRLYWRKEDI